MNAESKEWKPRLLIGGMVIIALCINYYFLEGRPTETVQSKSAQEPQKQAVAIQKVTNQNPVAAVAAENAKFAARYLVESFPPKTGSRNMAVAVASEDGKLNYALTTMIATSLHNQSVHVLLPFFKPEFVSDGLFNDAFAGSSDLFRKLGLAASVDVLLLARQDIQYSQDASLNNLVTATMRLEVVAVPMFGQNDRKTWTFTAYGPGFTKDVARTAAQDRIIKQMEADAKMSADQIFQTVQFR